MARELDEYFGGRRREFDVPVDLSLATGAFAAPCWSPCSTWVRRPRQLRRAGADVGNPRAVRAVGTACARNPVPLVVPCHRVVRTDGSSGQYAGGAEAKSRLLQLEREARVEA